MKRIDKMIPQTNKISQGDCREIMRQWDDECIDMIITSPPYWSLWDYKLKPLIWDGDEKCEHKWGKQIVAKQSGGTNNPFADKKDWDLGERSQGNFCSLCGAWKGQLGLEPTFDLYIKHLCDIFDEVKRVLKKEGSIWVNMGTSIQDKCDTMIPERFAIEMINRGWIKRRTKIWHKPNPMPSSVKDDMTLDFEYIYFFVKNKKYYFEQQFEENETLKSKPNYRGKKNANKFGAGTKGIRQKEGDTGYINPQGRNMRCVWTIPTMPCSEAHFAVFPEKLLMTPIKSGCPEFICKKCGKAKVKIWEYEFKGATHHGGKRENSGYDGNLQWDKPADRTFKGYTDCGCGAGFEGGIVLDPFAGRGTTGIVAQKLGRKYILIDLSPEYVEMAKQNLSQRWLV